MKSAILKRLLTKVYKPTDKSYAKTKEMYYQYSANSDFGLRER